MSVDAVLRFLETSSEDEALRSALAPIIGAGDGDVGSAEALDNEEAEALLGERGVLVANFAGRRGYDFTVAELRAVVGLFQRHQTGELTSAEFASALGVLGAEPAMKAIGRTIGMVFMGIPYDRAVEDAADKLPHVVKFVQATAKDAGLREALRAILQVGDGDISSFAELDADEARALTGERAALVANFAAEQGFVFTVADLFAVIDAFRRVNAGEMSEATFAKFVRTSGSEALPFIGEVSEFTYKGFSYESARPSSRSDNALQVVRFMEKSKDDAKLREQLQAIIGGDGNISAPSELDATEARSLLGERSSQIVQLGAKHGFRFTPMDLSAVVGAFQMVESGALPMEDCMRILGLPKGAEADAPAIGVIAQTAGRIYRGIRYSIAPASG
jgi:hypothetical protein